MGINNFDVRKGTFTKAVMCGGVYMNKQSQEICAEKTPRGGVNLGAEKTTKDKKFA